MELCCEFSTEEVVVETVDDSCRIVIKDPKYVDEIEFFAMRSGIMYSITETRSGAATIIVAIADITPFTLRYGL